MYALLKFLLYQNNFVAVWGIINLTYQVSVKILLLFIDLILTLALYNFVLNICLPLRLKTFTVMV